MNGKRLFTDTNFILNVVTGSSFRLHCAWGGLRRGWETVKSDRGGWPMGRGSGPGQELLWWGNWCDLVHPGPTAPRTGSIRPASAHTPFPTDRPSTCSSEWHSSISARPPPVGLLPDSQLDFWQRKSSDRSPQWVWVNPPMLFNGAVMPHEVSWLCCGEEDGLRRNAAPWCRCSTSDADEAPPSDSIQIALLMTHAWMNPGPFPFTPTFTSSL